MEHDNVNNFEQLPFLDVNISYKQRCLKGHKDMKFASLKLLRCPSGFTEINSLTINKVQFPVCFPTLCLF